MQPQFFASVALFDSLAKTSRPTLSFTSKVVLFDLKYYKSLTDSFWICIFHVDMLKSESEVEFLNFWSGAKIVIYGFLDRGLWQFNNQQLVQMSFIIINVLYRLLSLYM